MTTLARSSALLALLVLSTAACSRKKPQVAPPAPAPEPAAAPVVDDSERLERERLERERAAREAAERARRAEIERTIGTTIYFGFDRYDLTAEARALLDAKWSVLQANPTIRLRIEGHADDLGSDEYNLALGNQRAAAAKRYFVQRDISDSRIEIVSFGEEQPACNDASESCRSLNRRGEFRIIGGFDVTAGSGR